MERSWVGIELIIGTCVYVSYLFTLFEPLPWIVIHPIEPLVGPLASARATHSPPLPLPQLFVSFFFLCLHSITHSLSLSSCPLHHDPLPKVLPFSTVHTRHL